MTNISRYPGRNNPWQDHQREGTVRQYESRWVLIGAGASREFMHGLDGIPRLVDVIYSDSEEGYSPTDATSIVTVVKADDVGTKGSGKIAVTVTNNDSDHYYFKVRAL